MSREKEEERRRRARLEEEKQEQARKIDQLAEQVKKMQEEVKKFKKVENPAQGEAQGAVKAAESPPDKAEPLAAQKPKASPPQERASKGPTKLERLESEANELKSKIDSLTKGMIPREFPENVNKMRSELAGKEKEVRLLQEACAEQTLAIVNIKNVYAKDDINRFKALDKRSPEQSANEVIGKISTGLIDFLRAEIKLNGDSASSKILNEVINTIGGLHNPNPPSPPKQATGFWASLTGISDVSSHSGVEAIPRDVQISAYINKVSSILETKSENDPNLQQTFRALKGALTEVNPTPKEVPRPK